MITCVFVDGVRQGLLESLLVHSTFDSANSVGKRVQAIRVVPGVPLKGHLELHRTVLGLFALLQVPHVTEQRFLCRVDVANKVLDTTLVAVHHFLRVLLGPLINKADL